MSRRATTGGSGNASDPEDQLWYYESLMTALRPNVPKALADELGRTVDAIRHEVRQSMQRPGA